MNWKCDIIWANRCYPDTTYGMSESNMVKTCYSVSTIYSQLTAESALLESVDASSWENRFFGGSPW